MAVTIAIASIAFLATVSGPTSIKHLFSAHAADPGDDQKSAADSGDAPKYDRQKERPALQKEAGYKKGGSPGSSCWAECINEAYRSSRFMGCTARCGTGK